MVYFNMNIIQCIYIIPSQGYPPALDKSPISDYPVVSKVRFQTLNLERSDNFCTFHQRIHIKAIKI